VYCYNCRVGPNQKTGIQHDRILIIPRISNFGKSGIPSDLDSESVTFVEITLLLLILIPNHHCWQNCIVVIITVIKMTFLCTIASMVLDLPTNQRSTVTVSTDEVCYWRRHDAWWPRRCFQPIGIDTSSSLVFSHCFAHHQLMGDHLCG